MIEESKSHTGKELPNKSRRRVLAWSGVLAIASAITGITGVLASFLTPQNKSNSFGGVINGGTIADLPEIGGKPKLIPEGRFWLIHTESGLTALHSTCTHLECRFSWDEQAKLFVCPCHGSRFTPEGKVKNGPANRSLDRFPIELIAEDGKIIRPPPQDAGPIQIFDLLTNQQEDESNRETTENTTLSVSSIYVRVDTGKKIAGASNTVVHS